MTEDKIIPEKGDRVYVVYLGMDEEFRPHSKPEIREVTVESLHDEDTPCIRVQETAAGHSVGIPLPYGGIWVDPAVPVQRELPWPVRWFRTAEEAAAYARTRRNGRAGDELVPAQTHDEVRSRLARQGRFGLSPARIPVSAAVADSFRTEDYLDFVGISTHGETFGQGDFRDVEHLEGACLSVERFPGNRRRCFVAFGRLGGSALADLVALARRAR